MKKADRKLIIDWNDLRKGYNNQNTTTYKTVEDFVRKIYLKCKTIEKTAMVLGVSRYALWKKMKALNIPRLPKGHRGACKSLRAIWGLDNVSEMTSNEIAKATGLTRNWVLVVLKRHNISFAKGLNRNAGMWGRIKPVGMHY